ncbi:MAG TPA: biotin/lipoyl-containing protein, partial [Acidimicrobiales bacterium]|nr:biotin/lipoyl-containing protein [Acidimicrobiales bacterium]
MADVTMPQLGETVTEGTITKWFKQVGDQVAEDEVLFEVSTDKVDSEVPSPVSGYLAEIRVPEGETVDVGAVLAVLSDAPVEGGDGGAAEPAAESGGEEAGGEEAAAEPEPEAEAEEAAAAAPPDPEQRQEPAAAPAEREPAPAPAPPAAGGGGGGGGGGKLLSPVVRRLIAEHHLDPEQIEGTGAGGRITRSDVQKVIESGGGGERPAAAAAPAAAPAPQPA